MKNLIRFSLVIVTLLSVSSCKKCIQCEQQLKCYQCSIYSGSYTGGFGNYEQCGLTLAQMNAFCLVYGSTATLIRTEIVDSDSRCSANKKERDSYRATKESLTWVCTEE